MSDFDRLLASLSELEVEDNAKQAHDAVEYFLSSHGFICEREYKIEDRGDGRPGRIDLLAVKGATRVAIEIDDHVVRQKSVSKLIQFRDCIKVVILRNPGGSKKKNIKLVTEFPGIDAVISLQVR